MTHKTNPDNTHARSQLARVLVVDDDPKQVNTLLALLKKEGFEARRSTSATEALSAIENEEFSVAIVDLRLSDIQGPQLVKLLLEKTRSIKTIIHAGYGSFEAAKDAINQGAFGFVEKGGDLRELICQVHRAAKSRLNHFAEVLEEALKKSEAKYQDLYNHAPDMMASVDPRTASILQCNETLLTATGYSHEEIIGRPIFEMYHPDSLENARQNFKLFQEAGEIHNAELQLQRKDGSTVDVLLNVTAVRDEQGRILHSRSIWRDITERKQAEREKAEQQVLVNLMLNTGPGCINRVAADGTLLSINPAGLQLIEASCEQEAVGLLVFDLVLTEHRSAFESMHREVLQGKEQTLQYEIQSLKGTRRWMETYAVPFHNPITKKVEHLAVTHDITQRKAIEAHERSTRKQIEAISEVQTSFMEAGKPAEVFKILLEHLLELTTSEYGFIGEVLYQETGEPYLRTHVITDIAWDEETRELIKRFSPHLEFFNLNTLFGQVMTTGQPVLANDPAHDPRRGGLPKGHPPLNAFLGMPLYQGDQLIGMVGMANRPGGYTQDIVEYLQPFLATCANLIEAYRQKESVRTLESHLHQAIQASKTGLWERNIQTNTMFYSAEWKAQLGYEEHEITNRFTEWENRLHPDDHDRVLDYKARYVANPEGEYSQEFRLRHKDGTYRWMASRAAFVPEADGRLVRLLGSHTDITATKEIEAQLNGIIHSAMDGIITTNDKHEVTLFNAAAENMFGCSAEEVIGQSINRFIPERYRESHHHHVERFGISGETKRKMGELGSIVGLRANGEEFPLEASISKLELGHHSLYTVILRDITERKTAEATLRKFERIVSSSRSLLSLIDRDYRYQAVNQQYLDVFGAPREHVLGHTMGDLLGQEYFDRVVKAHIDRCFADEVVGFKHWLDLPTIGRRYMDVLLSPYKDERDIVQAIVLEARDITDLHHLEEQVRHSQKLEAIGTLAAGIAHDFNNLLTVILGFGELASLKVPGNQPVQHNLSEIVRAGKRAKDLVRQILLFSRQAEPRWETLDIRTVVQESLGFLRASIPSTIDISQDVGPTPIFVNGDATQLEQVILNLGANAEQAMRSRGKQLDITLHSVELDSVFIQSFPQLHPGLFARLTFQDTGAGIAQDILTKIFDPFFTTKDVHEGTGLGLSVVHGIVTAHGGVIMVNSEPEHGTTFTIYLPQVSQPEGEEESDISQLSHLTLAGKILIIDDEESLSRLTQKMLETVGYEVEAFSQPTEALEVFRAEPEKFSVAITDQAMPGLTGEEMIKKLLAIRPNLPIILCTGYSHNMNAAKALSLGATAFLLKPFLKDDLLSALNTALHPEE